jgi:hypothetical protein
LAWAQGIAKFVQRKTGIEVQTLVRVAATQDVVWLQRYPGLAEYEKALEQIQSDAEYWGYVKDAETKGFFDTPNVEAGIWREL